MSRRRLVATTHTTMRRWQHRLTRQMSWRHIAQPWVPYSNTTSSGKCYDATWHSHRCHIATSDAMWRTHRHHAEPRATWHQRMTIRVAAAAPMGERKKSLGHSFSKMMILPLGISEIPIMS
ncbi:hypothetical protein B296_00045320 [Ensete ventricosum]|uniref:Uncharacterized protein n=1 Tax=Ensete ventricosum TaxID=4639 RepID=A0A426Y6L0_ENSVE|nr:hypothetical protein B296_00045320 [Ensete ventricosum]